MRKLPLNLSLIAQPCVVVAAIVVSEMNERLSPNIAPPTTTPQIRGSETSILPASSIAIGATAVTVPMDVPIENEMTHAMRKSPGSTILAGVTESMRFVALVVAPIAPATP